MSQLVTDSGQMIEKCRLSGIHLGCDRARHLWCDAVLCAERLPDGVPLPSGAVLAARLRRTELRETISTDADVLRPATMRLGYFFLTLRATALLRPVSCTLFLV